MATGIVLLGVVITYVIYLITGLPITTMVGILSGAVTNTPGLGAAQQAYSDMTGIDSPDIAMGYAVAYPLGVLGIILSMIFIPLDFQDPFRRGRQGLYGQTGRCARSRAYFGRSEESVSGRKDRFADQATNKQTVRYFPRTASGRTYRHRGFADSAVGRR